MRLDFYFKELIGSFLLICASACGDEKESSGDPYQINYANEVLTNAMVVNTKIGWTLLSEKYGYLELLEPLRDD